FLLHLLISLLGQDFVILTASTPAQARELLAQHQADIVLTGQQFSNAGEQSETGTLFLDWMRLHHPTAVRILICPRTETDCALNALNQGQAQRLLLTPWQTETLLQIVRQAARTVLLERSHEQLLEELRRLNLELEQRVQQRTAQLEEVN